MSCGYCMQREYAGHRGGFGVAAVFLFIGLISLVMRNAGIQFFGLYAWGYWLFVPAFFIMIGSISQVSMDRRIRQDVASLIRQGGSRVYTIDEIAIEAGVRRHCVPRVLMDLRDLGLIAYTQDARTGEIAMGGQAVYQQAANFQPVVAQVIQKRYHFCMNCGQKLEEASGKKYCPNCGSLVP